MSVSVYVSLSACMSQKVHAVRSLLRAGVQPTLDPSVETIERSNALA